jgi:hypothetical protein
MSLADLGGIEMQSDHDRKTPKRRTFRDRASRLLRPHLLFIREARASDAAPEIAGVLEDEGQFRSAGQVAVDIICCGMYRACSTWQYEVIAHIVERHVGGTRLGYLTAAQYRNLDRDLAADNHQTGRSARVLKSHEGGRVFAQALAAGNAVGVYAFRDVRDVVFSLAHKRKLSFEQLLRQGMIHQILANDRFWSRCPNLLVQRYEDLLRKPIAGVLALARHIGVNLDHSEAELIAREYSQDANRARTAALRHRLHEGGIDLDRAGNAQICDATTLLHWNHMRDPDSCWRSEATAEQEAILNRLCGRWLVDHGYERRASGGWWSSIVGSSPHLSLRATLDIMIGRLNYAVRNTSLRFPVAVFWLKRLLGMTTDEANGAIAWSEKGGGNSGPGRESSATESSARSPVAERATRAPR